eukprot:18304_1
MGTTTTTTTKVHVYTGEATKLKEQIASYHQLLDNKQAAIKDAQTKIADNKALVGQYTDEYKAANDVANASKDLEIPEKVPFDVAKKRYEHANNEINAVLDKTGEMPEQVVDFLRLTNKIIPTVNKQNGYAQTLMGKIDLLNDFLDRDCNTDARIKDVFVPGRYKRLAYTLNQNVITLCSEIEGDQKWCDETIIPMLKQGIQTASDEYDKFMEEHKNDDTKDEFNKKKFNKRKTDLEDLMKPWDEAFDERKVKAIVVEPRAWKEEQVKKTLRAKMELDKFSPIMVRFFDTAYNTIKLALEILEINQGALNAAQKKALESEDDEKKAIEAPQNDENNSDMLDFSGVGSIVKNKVLSHEIAINAALVNIVVQNLDIVNSADFKDDFEKNSGARIFAQAVEGATIQMMRCIGAERGQIILAQKILDMKPAKVNVDENKFWKSISEGLVQIYKSVGTINEASRKFFNYFLEFEDSFDKYIKFGQDISYVQKDVKRFLEFKDEYGEKLESLSDSALNTIVACIKENIGTETVKQALDSVEPLRKNYSTALAAYNVAYTEQMKTYFEKAKIAAEIKGKKEKAQSMIDFYTQFITDTKDDSQIQAKIDALNEKLKDPTTSDYTLVDQKIVKKT